MIEKEKPDDVNKGEQLKRFGFFNVENIQEKVIDVASHPVTFGQLAIKDIKAIYPKYLIKPSVDCTYCRTYLELILSTSSPTKLLESGSRTPIVPS
jgi:hypothetical protein